MKRGDFQKELSDYGTESCIIMNASDMESLYRYVREFSEQSSTGRAKR
ncbi:MAG: hypothetical protein ACLVIY_05765 [Anaerobutyricum soehngenii]